MDACGFGWIGLLEECKAFAEACGVFVGYGEDADAALGAAGMADEVVASATVRVGDCGVYDLDEVGLVKHKINPALAAGRVEEVRLMRWGRAAAQTTGTEIERLPSTREA